MDNVLGIFSIICVAVYIITIIADKVTDYFKSLNRILMETHRSSLIQQD